MSKNKLFSILEKIDRFFRPKRYPLILVYTMGKVGSSTLQASLKKYYPARDIKHVHFLSDFYLEDVLPKTNHKQHIEKGHRIKGWVEKAIKRDRPVKIITLTREPIGRSISNFFQNPIDFIDGPLEEYSKEALFDAFSNKLDFDYVQNWFDEEFRNFTGIDIYSYPFDHEKGFTIINDHPNFEVLAMKLEALNDCFSPALKAFLRKDISNLYMANESKKKQGVLPILQYFKENLRLDSKMINSIYESKYMQHFYTSNEIEEFKAKWTSDIEDHSY
jgi:hypothetical protein